MQTPFVDIFIILIDSVLKDKYDNPIPRKDYLTFFEFFERRMSHNEINGFKSVEINNNKERLNWGRITTNKKVLWKLDIILKTLKELHIINCSGYEPNRHSRRYLYTESLLNAIDAYSFNIVYEETNEKIYNAFKNSKLYDTSISQYRLLKSNNFTIDVNKCISYLIELYNIFAISKTNLILNIRRVFDIYNKDIYAVKINNGRIYTSFSSLKKELRQFCYIDNESLISIDLKSSQPYLLASYLNHKYPNVPDVQNFYDLVIHNDIYEWIMSKDLSIKSRDDSKKEVFQYIFKITNKGNCITQQIVKKEFPILNDIISAERKQLNGLANFLQSIEADLFIPICERYSDDCLSVHDSLYYTKRIETEIEKEILNRFEEKGFHYATLNINNNNTINTINVVHFAVSASSRNDLRFSNN